MSSPVVCSFESRRADDLAALIERHGGIAVMAPSMREIPIDDNPQAIDCIQRVIRGEFDVVILLTGVGTTALFDVAAGQGQLEALLAGLRTVKLVIRGPKPAAVLQRVDVRYDLKAPEPNTWRELLSALDESDIALNGAQVAVQEYGVPNQRLLEELHSRGAVVTAVPVYKWALPHDTEPLQQAIQRVIDGAVDVVLFTSANQLTNVVTMAGQMGCEAPFRAAAAQLLLGSIGPTCTEAMQEQGFPVHFEASPPKMGPLVRGAIEAWKVRTG